jgi:hypothetical protein
MSIYKKNKEEKNVLQNGSMKEKDGVGNFRKE